MSPSAQLISVSRRTLLAAFPAACRCPGLRRSHRPARPAPPRRHRLGGVHRRALARRLESPVHDHITRLLRTRQARPARSAQRLECCPRVRLVACSRVRRQVARIDIAGTRHLPAQPLDFALQPAPLPLQLLLARGKGLACWSPALRHGLISLGGTFRGGGGGITNAGRRRDHGVANDVHEQQRATPMAAHHDDLALAQTFELQLVAHAWPSRGARRLNHSKLHLVSAVPQAHTGRLRVCEVHEHSRAIDG
eukprot:1461958-Prymnesium_polylepis.1